MTETPATPCADVPTLIVPGISGSGPQHWQTLWEQRHARWRRVTQRDWKCPVREEWIAALDAAIVSSPVPPVLVAHSMGCLVVAHWVGSSAALVRTAFLVAVPDPDGPNFPSAAQGFTPVPLKRFPFPSLVVASTDDPFGSIPYARRCASVWGSAFTEIESAGHINADSGHGEWPAGFALLRQLLRIPG